MASKKFMRIFWDGGVTVLDLGCMEIWDGADMALLRESLTQLIVSDKRRSIGIDMAHVKYIPSGFFGMLFDWYETGVQIRLYSPQPNVQSMLWFSRFFERIDENCHQLAPQAIVDEFPVSSVRQDRAVNGHASNGYAADGLSIENRSPAVLCDDSEPPPATVELRRSGTKKLAARVLPR